MPTFMPLVSSTFTSDENPLREGSNWATDFSGAGDYKKLSGVAQPTNFGLDSGARYVGLGASFDANQYARANLTVSGSNSAAGIGLSLRASSSARTMYRFFIDHHATANANLDRFVNGSFQALASFLFPFTDGDQFTFAIADETLFVFDKNLVLIRTYNDPGGGVATPGLPGLAFSSSVNSCSLDNFEAGNFTTLTMQQLSVKRMVGVGYWQG